MICDACSKFQQNVSPADRFELIDQSLVPAGLTGYNKEQLYFTEIGLCKNHSSLLNKVYKDLGWQKK